MSQSYYMRITRYSVFELQWSVFLHLDPADWWLSPCGLYLFSGVYTSAVKRGGNMKSEAFKVIVVVFLVEE